MEKRIVNSIISRIIKKQASSGTMEIHEIPRKGENGKELIVFAEIEVSDKDNETIISMICEELENQFFNAPSQNDEYAFENALAKANIRVKDTLLSKPKNWLLRMHIAAVALCKDEIHIAPVGNVHAFLVHNQKISDVLKSASQIPSPNPVKLFTNIVSGKLGIGNAVVLANESVLDYLSEERIRKSAHEYEINQAMEKIFELLSRAPLNKKFGISIIKREYKTEEIKTMLPILSDERIADIDENQEIEKFELKNSFNARAKISKIAEKTKPYAQKALTITLSIILKILEQLQKFLANLMPIASKIAVLALTLWKNSKARSYYAEKIKERFRGAILIVKSVNPKKLGKRGIAGTAIFFLVVVFGISISFKAQEKGATNEQVNITVNVQEIQSKISQAEASLIYENKLRALILISEAETKLAELLEKYPKKENEYSGLKPKIEDLKNRSEKKKNLDPLSSFAAIIPSPVRSNETGLLAAENGILFFDGVQEKISNIDSERGLILTIPFENQGIESFSAAISLGENEIAAIKKETVLIIDVKEETIKKQRFEYDASISAKFAGYSGNIYTFDASSNKITRYRRAGSGFTTAQNWLTQEYELSTMSDIAVDGFVYLIDSAGNIHVFLSGKFNKRIPWPLPDFPKENIRLYTNDSIGNFYVLDPKNSRVVRMAKNGDFINQLYSKEFENGSDLAVDKGEKNLYVLSLDKIYKIDLSK